MAAAAALTVGARPLRDAPWTSFGHDQQLTGYTDAQLYAFLPKR